MKGWSWMVWAVGYDEEDETFSSASLAIPEVQKPELPALTATRHTVCLFCHRYHYLAIAKHTSVTCPGIAYVNKFRKGGMAPIVLEDAILTWPME